jgi:hypothetical protein
MTITREKQQVYTIIARPLGRSLDRVGILDANQMVNLCGARHDGLAFHWSGACSDLAQFAQSMPTVAYLGHMYLRYTSCPSRIDV